MHLELFQGCPFGALTLQACCVQDLQYIAYEKCGMGIYPINGTRHKMKSKKIAFYLRNCGNIHYFASIKPYLDYFLSQGVHENYLVVREYSSECQQLVEYHGYHHLLTTNHDLDSYDLVVTPTFLRAEERTENTCAVQIFHGMSDKPFTYGRDFSGYIRCLCAGQRQLDRLKQNKRNRTAHCAIIGYPKFDNPVSSPPLFNNNKKTIIYCPTWRKGNISSIEHFLKKPAVIEQILADYNLIVKPHPNIFNPRRKLYNQHIVDNLRKRNGIILLRSGNVMPWFQQSDLYIGDISASGYEWLYFDRPMIFLNPQPGVLRPSSDPMSITFLWQCGDVCNRMEELKDTIDTNLRKDSHHSIREAILNYSVFEPRKNKATQRGIAQIDQILEAAHIKQA
jgi:hypothetical protein